MLSLLPTSDGFRVLQIRFSGIPKISLEINLRRQEENACSTCLKKIISPVHFHDPE